MWSWFFNLRNCDRTIKLAILLIFVKFSSCTRELLIPNINNHTNLCECLNTALNKYLRPNEGIKVYQTTDVFCYISRPSVIQRDFNFNTIIFLYRKHTACIVYSNEETINNLYSTVKSYSTFNSRALYFLVYSGDKDDLFKILKRYFIYNVILIMENKSKVDLYTYFPYENENCNDVNYRTAKIASCDDCTNFNHLDLFPNKLPNKWSNTTVRALPIQIGPYVLCPTCPIKGFEIDLFEIIANELKFKYIYLQDDITDWGFKMDNGTYSYGLGYVEQQKADVTFGLYHYKPEAFIDIDHITSYTSDCVSWVTPKARILPSWSSLINIFDHLVWSSIVALTIIVSALWIFIIRLLHLKQGLFKTVTLPFRILLENPVAKIELNAIEIKILFFAWWLFTFQLLTTYRAHLIGFLVHPTYEVQISSLEELKDSGYAFGVYPELAEYYNYPEDGELGKYIFKHAEDCNVGYFCLNQTAHTRRYITAISCKMFHFLIPQLYLDDTGHAQLFKFKEQIQTDYITMFFSKGFPLMPQIERIVTNLRIAGIIKKLEEYTQFKNILMNNRYLDKDLVISQKVLGIKEIYGPLVFIFLGLSISIIVFVLELAIWTIKPKKSSINNTN